MPSYLQAPHLFAGGLRAFSRRPTGRLQGGATIEGSSPNPEGYRCQTPQLIAWRYGPSAIPSKPHRASAVLIRSAWNLKERFGAGVCLARQSVCCLIQVSSSAEMCRSSRFCVWDLSGPGRAEVSPAVDTEEGQTPKLSSRRQHTPRPESIYFGQCGSILGLPGLEHEAEAEDEDLGAEDLNEPRLHGPVCLLLLRQKPESGKARERSEKCGILCCVGFEFMQAQDQFGTKEDCEHFLVMLGSLHHAAPTCMKPHLTLLS